MSSQTTAFSDGKIVEGFEPYRAVSKAAVTSLIFGVISLIGLMFPVLLLIPVAGLLLGLLAYRNIRRYPREMSGLVPALLGIVLCGGIFVVGTAAHSYIYATEVPEGYERISFTTLKAGSRAPDVPPPEAVALDGRQIFIKGYIYPGQQRRGLKQFVLVPDLGTCCFGGDPKLTHMVEVTLSGKLRMNYSMTKRKLGGVLKVQKEMQPVAGRPGVYYQLIADYAK